MQELVFFFFLFIAQTIVLFFVVQSSINTLFYILQKLFRSQSIAYRVLAFIFLPGTIVHELSHFLMALILGLRVRDIHIFPEWKGASIKLGYVLYEKKDPFRGILVGIAPLIVGILFLWWISALEPFYIDSLFIKIAIFYLVFAITSTMFSSKQDMVDSMYSLPIIILIAACLFFFQTNPFALVAENSNLLANTLIFLYAINWYLFYSLIIHLIFIIVIYFIKK